MIYFLYGEDIFASQKLLDKLRQENSEKELVWVDGRKDEEVIILAQSNLFNRPKFFIIENAALNKNFRLPQTLSDSDLIVFWEKDELDPRKLKFLPPKVQIEHFKPKAPIFAFLDNLRPGDQSQSLSELVNLTSSVPDSLIFHLLLRRLRNLILAKSDNVDLRVADWQLKNLRNQARLFEADKLLSAYHDLFEIERASKTGTQASTLEESLAFWVLSLGKK